MVTPRATGQASTASSTSLLPIPFCRVIGVGRFARTGRRAARAAPVALDLVRNRIASNLWRARDAASAVAAMRLLAARPSRKTRRLRSRIAWTCSALVSYPTTSAARANDAAKMPPIAPQPTIRTRRLSLLAIPRSCRMGRPVCPASVLRLAGAPQAAVREDVVDAAEELIRTERFAQRAHRTEALGDFQDIHPPRADIGHGDDAGRGIEFENVAYRLDAFLVRHDDVRDHEIGPAFAVQFEAGVSVGGLDDQVPGGLQDVPHDLPDLILVVDHQNCVHFKSFTLRRVLTQYSQMKAIVALI